MTKQLPPRFPHVLASYRGLPGEYGVLEVTAKSPIAVAFQLTAESF